VLTGDTLFVGAVGRPDLLGREHEMAGILFDTLQHKLLPLPDTWRSSPGTRPAASAVRDSRQALFDAGLREALESGAVHPRRRERSSPT